jgi:hypothetical protein
MLAFSRWTFVGLLANTRSFPIGSRGRLNRAIAPTHRYHLLLNLCGLEKMAAKLPSLRLLCVPSCWNQMCCRRNLRQWIGRCWINLGFCVPPNVYFACWRGPKFRHDGQTNFVIFLWSSQLNDFLNKIA